MRLILTVVGCLWLSGCSSVPQVSDTEIDTEYRLLADRAIAYSSAVPALSIAARDYIYLMPVEQFEAGRWSPSLWVGVASTLDRGFQRLQLSQPQQLVFNIDGKVVRLPLMPWELGSEPPIPTKVNVAHNLRSVIDYELLQALATAKSVVLTLGRSSQNQQLFSHWRGRWQESESRSAAEGVEIAAKAHRPPIIQR